MSIPQLIFEAIKPPELRSWEHSALLEWLHADILGVIETRCRTLKNNFVPDVTALFREKLKMDLSIDDYDARVFQYYQDCSRIVENNGPQGLIANDEQKEGAQKRYRTAKEQRNASIRFKTVQSGAGRSLVRINGLLEVAYIPDSADEEDEFPVGAELQTLNSHCLAQWRLIRFTSVDTISNLLNTLPGIWRGSAGAGL
ncbi:uncharacterized protein PITG_05129 [Phytophthora infestans T30-4]|uniref:Uncharacterized protein n=1 Tax=Phytophthora infestans (strain T30-4) TaxID=403677 RepID=D0N3M1_PHYIT|nr:uncharacterized protein PITG_05129 [Phytophthora infestans T30-4]EEY68975.1 conserved hypothetical protein [Phytophthora infestans T30-4]|eukprot:XP_002998829.1 conserved hypothetical protein [Phytophthora infestans T30-4]